MNIIINSNNLINYALILMLFIIHIIIKYIIYYDYAKIWFIITSLPCAVSGRIAAGSRTYTKLRLY